MGVIIIINEMEKLRFLQSKADVLKGIAHPIKLCILKCLTSSEECNVTKLTQILDKPQATISQHLSKMKALGIVEGHRHGTEVQYVIIDEEVKKIISILLNDLIEQGN